ncbi:hypothetical protein GCM10011391_37560 [Pullulanibacillus camelliae]|uniref:Uncharacterized protein n=2 Tax=Pullulanibacillus camelliae TaxID=1707096 RepID=A0A8J2YN61_9BACL|nr:hypothetical protein GCM10011391_37560 [Pullulanibacillus camelliae]
MFNLQHCAKLALKKYSGSEIHRAYYVKHYMMGAGPLLFHEPVHGVDVGTINVFINMLQKLID